MEEAVIDTDLEEVSLCSLVVAGATYGIDTRKIREVLGRRELQPVPLAPGMIAGVVPYRGEVLTAVSLRVLLGLEAPKESGCVVVLEGDEGDVEERFGLVVDRVGGVVTVNSASLTANPWVLDARTRACFDGAYRLPTGLMVRLDPAKLRPTRERMGGREDAVRSDVAEKKFAAGEAPGPVPMTGLQDVRGES